MYSLGGGVWPTPRKRPWRIGLKCMFIVYGSVNQGQLIEKNSLIIFEICPISVYMRICSRSVHLSRPSLEFQCGRPREYGVADPIYNIVQQTQFRIWFCRPSLEYGVCIRPSLEYDEADLVQNMVQQTQFRIWCSRPSLEFQCGRPSLENGVADPVQNIVWQTQLRIWFCRPSLEYGFADPVQNMVLQTQLRIWCSRPSLEYGFADPVQNIV